MNFESVWNEFRIDRKDFWKNFERMLNQFWINFEWIWYEFGMNSEFIRNEFLIDFKSKLFGIEYDSEWMGLVTVDTD